MPDYGIKPLRISIVDERCEISSKNNGIPQFDVGLRSDVLDNCPKAAAIMIMIRSMNPQVIALDEITSPEDIKAMVSAINCGVKLIATAHAENLDDLLSRPVYRELTEYCVFNNLIVISKDNQVRKYDVEKIGKMQP